MHGMIGKPLLVSVSARPRIGRLEVIRREFTEGTSLAEMATEIGPKMPPEFWAIGIALIDDGGPIEPRYWHLVRPKAGHCVAFHPMPGKSGGLLQSFAQIGIIALQAAAYNIPGVGPLVAAGVGLGGAALLGAMAGKKKTPKPPKQLGQAGFSDNVLAPYEQIPRVLGIRRVPANYLAPPITEISGDNALGRAVTGLAGRYDIREIEMAGGPAEFVASNLREGDASDLDLTIYTDVRWQEVPKDISRHNLLVETATDVRRTYTHSPALADVHLYDEPRPQYFRLGRRRFPDRIVIDLLFDQGIYNVVSSGKGGVALQLFFVKTGAASIYLPELHLAGNYKIPTRARLVIEFAADPGGITAPSSNSIWRQAFAASNPQGDIDPIADAHSYYGTAAVATHVGVSAPNTCTVYVDPASIPLDGAWRFAFRVGCGYITDRMDFSNNKYQYEGGISVGARWYGIEDYAGFGAPYLAFEDQAMSQTHLQIENFTRIYDTPALEADGIATYEIKTQNQSTEQITFLAGSYVDKRWDSVTSTWVAEPHVSNNPAELAYDIMTNASPALNARPLSPSLVDDLSFGAWAAYCTAQGLTCNAYIESGTVEDALQICFEAGHAYLKRSQKWGVYIEKSRLGETPVMVFSPRNSRGLRIERSYEHRPHALRVTFDDEDDDYQTNPGLVVYAPGYGEVADTALGILRATLFQSQHYPGITQGWQAIARANINLGIIWYRSKVYILETDARYLVAGRSDLVGISHFILNAAHGYAAIREVIRQEVGGVTKITGFRLDTDLDLQSGTTGIAINSYGGTVVSGFSGQAGKTRELILTAPLADDPEIEAGCTLTSGALSAMRFDCIIDDVQPGAGGTAKLILYDAAPEIFGPVAAGNDLYASPDLFAETDLYNLDN